MFRPVDEKIVRMKLDNSDFQSKAAETVGIFGKLRDGLNKIPGVNLGKTATELSRLGDNAHRVDMNGLAGNVQKVADKFSSLGIIGITALQELTKKAIDSGIKIGRALINPIVEGGRKRALNIEQAKFQFEGLGMDVEASMDSALKAVSGTAFGLDEAAMAASQLGASGIEAGDDMTSALTAISGLAAMTGSDYSSIANIFTTVAGNGRLMSMQLLQFANRGINVAASLAEEMGVTESAVREMVTAGEIDFETFYRAMDNAFGEHATKANETFAGSLGNVRAAMSRIGASIATPAHESLRKIFVNLIPVIDDLADSLSPLIERWAELMELGSGKVVDFMGGLNFDGFGKGVMALWNSFENIIRAIAAVLAPIRDAFRTIFPSSSESTILNLATGMESLTEKLIISESTAGKIRDTFVRFFTAIQDGLKWVDQMIGRVKDWVRENDTLHAVFDRVVELLKAGYDAVRNLSQGFGGKLLSAFQSFGDVLKKLEKPLRVVWDFIKELVSTITVEDILSAGFIGGVIIGAKKISGVSKSFTDFLEVIKNTISSFTGVKVGKSDVLSRFGESLRSFSEGIKATTLVAIAASVILIAIAMRMIANLPAEDIAKGLQVMAVSLASMSITLQSISKMDMKGTGPVKAIGLIVALAGAVVVLAAGLKILSTIDAEDMGRSMLALVGIIGSLVTAIAILSKLPSKISTGAVAMVGLATAVVILSGALKILATIDADDLVKSISALGIIFLELAAFIVIVRNSKLKMSTAIATQILAGAIVTMVGAIKLISLIDTPSLVKGLSTLGIILLELAIFTKLTSGSKVLGAATAMVMVAGALTLMVVPIKQFGGMDLVSLGKGLGTMAVSLGLIVAALQLSRGTLGAAASVTAMAIAINLLVPPLVVLGNMSLAQLATALGALAVSFGLIAVAAKLLGPVGSISLIAFAVGLGAAALAIGAIAAVIGTFVVAITTLAAMTATSVTAAVASLKLLAESLIGIIPTIVDLAVEIVVSLARGLTTAIPELVTAAGEVIIALLEGMRDYLPRAAGIVIDLVATLLYTLGEELPRLIDSGAFFMKEFIWGMAEAIENNQQSILDAVIMLFFSIGTLVIEGLARVVDILFGWLPGVSEATKAIGDGAYDAMYEAFGIEEIAERRTEEYEQMLIDKRGESEQAGKEYAGAAKEGVSSVTLDAEGEVAAQTFTSGMSRQNPHAKETGTQMVNETKKGASIPDLSPEGRTKTDEYNKGISDRTDYTVRNGRGMAGATKKGVNSQSLTRDGQIHGNQYADGIQQRFYASESAGRGTANRARSGAGSVSFSGTGYNAARGFASGASTGRGGSNVENAGRSMGSRLLSGVRSILGIFSPSRVLRGDGQESALGFALGVEDGTDNVVSSAEAMAQKAAIAVKSYAKLFSEALEDGMDLQPVIKPVMDLSNIESADLRSTTNVSGFRKNYNANDILDENRSGGAVYNYHLNINAEGITNPTQFARQVEKEIKRLDDRRRASRGERVTFG